MDAFSKSDPFIVLYMNTGYTSLINAGWVKVGKTEVIYDNLNPKVTTDIQFNAHAGIKGCAYILVNLSSKRGKSRRIT